MATLTLIAYDVPDDRRRRRMATLLEGYGERVQDSVFECWLSPRERTVLMRRLRQLADATTDKIRLYVLCEKDRADVLCVGVGALPRAPEPPVI